MLPKFNKKMFGGRFVKTTHFFFTNIWLFGAYRILFVKMTKLSFDTGELKQIDKSSTIQDPEPLQILSLNGKLPEYTRRLLIIAYPSKHKTFV